MLSKAAILRTEGVRLRGEHFKHTHNVAHKTGKTTMERRPSAGKLQDQRPSDSVSWHRNMCLLRTHSRTSPS